jgi:hypothetical protein
MRQVPCPKLPGQSKGQDRGQTAYAPTPTRPPLSGGMMRDCRRRVWNPPSSSSACTFPQRVQIESSVSNPRVSDPISLPSPVSPAARGKQHLLTIRPYPSSILPPVNRRVRKTTCRPHLRIIIDEQQPSLPRSLLAENFYFRPQTRLWLKLPPVRLD